MNLFSDWAKVFRSLKHHGSSPERVLDLLCFLHESSDEKMQKMDLDDVTVTMEQVAAGRSALREAIGDAELAVQTGEKRWNWHQVASSLCWWPCLGSKDLPILQALDARASILTTRLEEEAEEENDTCLQLKSNASGLFFVPLKILIFGIRQQPPRQFEDET